MFLSTPLKSYKPIEPTAPRKPYSTRKSLSLNSTCKRQLFTDNHLKSKSNEKNLNQITPVLSPVTQKHDDNLIFQMDDLGWLDYKDNRYNLQFDYEDSIVPRKLYFE